VVVARDQPWRSWKHITKLDPDRKNSLTKIETIVQSGTDAVMISGTQNITSGKVSLLIDALSVFDIPKILEPATPDAVVSDGIDYIFVPMVLNAGDLQWVVGKHRDWIMKGEVDWHMVVPEAYIVLNPRSAVAQVTRANTSVTVAEVCAYAVYADKFLHLPIVYLEYSGVYGDPAVVQQVSAALTEATLLYGGGIVSRATALEMMQFADVIVVGNVAYTALEQFLETIP
jgi:phosphoglycerol geranylgeranyltransferase